MAFLEPGDVREADEVLFLLGKNVARGLGVASKLLTIGA
jgi:hypothetical protein